MPLLIVPNSWGSRVWESNDCHEPAGQPTGGQFCSKTGGGSKRMRVPRTKNEAWKLYRESASTMRHYDSYGKLEPLDLPERPPRKRPGHHDQWDVTGVTPAMVKAVEEAAQKNLDDNPLFHQLTESFGGYLVLTRVTPPDEEDRAVTGRYEGGACVVLFDNFWTRHSMESGRISNPDEPAPDFKDNAVAAQNFAGVIRHEYAHYIEARIRSDEHAAENRAYMKDYFAALRAYEDAGRPGGEFHFGAVEWHQQYREEHPSKLREFNELTKSMGFEKIEAQISYYAATNFRDLNERSSEVMTETFAEAFTLWTHPKLDRKVFPEEANKLFDWFDRHLKGYTP